MCYNYPLKVKPIFYSEVSWRHKKVKIRVKDEQVNMNRVQSYQRKINFLNFTNKKPHPHRNCEIIDLLKIVKKVLKKHIVSTWWFVVRDEGCHPGMFSILHWLSDDLTVFVTFFTKLHGDRRWHRWLRLLCVHVDVWARCDVGQVWQIYETNSIKWTHLTREQPSNSGPAGWLVWWSREEKYLI